VSKYCWSNTHDWCILS